MARHHSKHSEHSTPRSWPTRIFALLTLALPVIFYLMSMSFALKTIYDPSYAESIVYDDTPNVTKYTQKASPFFSCTPYPAGAPLSEIQSAKQTCTREHLWGSHGFTLCLANSASSLHICQQRVYSAGLYVAGTSLVGLAFLSSIIALALGITHASSPTEEYAYTTPGRSSHSKSATAEADAEAENGTPTSTGHPSSFNPTWRNFTLALGILLAALSALCLFIAHFLAYNSLVSDQAPSGDVGLSNPLRGTNQVQSPWYLAHTGVVYASMAWLTAGIGVLISGLGAGLGGL